MIRHARAIRSFMSHAQEYRVRRGAYRLLPVRDRSPFDLLIHACTWKSASQYVRLVLTDPAVYRATGLLPELAPLLYRPTTGFKARIPARRLVTPLYALYPEVVQAMAGREARAIFVKRDPRDLLVSRYYSRLSAHPTSPQIESLRAELQAMDREAGLRHVLATYGDIGDRLRSWAEAAGDPRVHMVAYEELVGRDQHRVWRGITDHFQIPLDDAALGRVLKRYSFENLAGGRRAGAEKTNHKYRKGVSGDWRNHFDTALTDAFRAATGDLVERLGYRW